MQFADAVAYFKVFYFLTIKNSIGLFSIAIRH